MIFEIFGQIGSGKSVFLTHTLHEFAFDTERNRQMRVAIAADNAESNKKRTIPPHCVSANYACTFRKFGYRPRNNRWIEPERLGLFDAGKNNHPHFNFPYEVIGIDEAQRWFSGKGGGVPAYQKRWFELHRHNHLDIYLATQRAINIDKDIRDLAQGIHVKELKKCYDKYGNIVKLKWTVNVISEGNIDAYLNATGNEKKKYYQKEVITAKYDVFSMYDSYCFKSKFEEGHEDEDYDLNYEVNYG